MRHINTYITICIHTYVYIYIYIICNHTVHIYKHAYIYIHSLYKGLLQRVEVAVLVRHMHHLLFVSGFRGLELGLAGFTG